MKTFRLFILNLLLIAMAAVCVFSQTTSDKTIGESKVVFISSSVFADPKIGITKYLTAVRTLQSEFKPIEDELFEMENKLQALSKEIQNLKENSAKKIPVDQSTINAKIDAGEKLQRELKYKQEDARMRAEKRERVLIAPLIQDIYKSIQEFSKQRGYKLVFDISKLEQTGIAMTWDEKADVTQEFISFYNLRSAAVSVTP